MDIGGYYSKSFGSFKKNLNIMIPSLIGAVLEYIIIILFLLLIVYLVMGPEFLSILKTGRISADYIAPNLTMTTWLLIAGSSLLVIILVGLISSYISAATIGMAKKIIETGGTELGVAWKSGKEYFIRIFLVSIIIGLMVLALCIPMLLGAFLQSVASTTIGFLILLIGIIFLGLGFMVVNQSIVIGKKSVIDSLNDSFEIFWNNKLNVFLVGLINFMIAIVVVFILGLIFGFIPIVGNLIGNVIISIILTPYFALVLSYLYLDLEDKTPITQ